MPQVYASISRRGGRICARGFEHGGALRQPPGRKRSPLWSLVLFSLAVVAPAAEFYVAPNGSASGDGSTARPWNLATGLGQPASVHPGDTIWLRGGRYTFPAGGNILIGLRGT